MICEPASLRVRADVVDCLLPRPIVKSEGWIRENIEVDGKPFNFNDYSWTVGVCEAFDDPEINTITICASAQIGKSEISRALFLCGLATQPSNGIFSTATEKLAINTTKKKIYPKIEECHALRDQLPPEHQRLQTRVDLRHGSIYVGWGGSVATLSDITAKFGHAGEIDKWPHEKSDEADPLELFDERFGAVRRYKVLKESTPSVTGSSRVWKSLLAGSNERLHVPCPLCGAHSELILGGGKRSEGGIVFDKPESGGLDPDLAFHTARYHCRSCHGEWRDHQKMPAVRRGVWCPEGCKVTKNGKLRGTARRKGPHRSFQVSRLYSPVRTFGEIARQFVLAREHPEKMRSFRNSWLGLPWSPVRRTAGWEEVAERLTLEYSLGHVPAEACFLTCGTDKQIDHMVYWVAAWGQGGRGWLIDYGVEPTMDGLERDVLNRRYPWMGHPGQSMPIELTLIDSRFEEEEVYQFCRRVSRVGRWVWPCKGAKAGTMSGVSWRWRDLDEQGQSSPRGKRHGMGDVQLVSVNTNYWQSYADAVLYERHPDGPGGFGIPLEARHDSDLMLQLINEVPDESRQPLVWVVVSQVVPVDLRDAFRYSRCAAEVSLRGKWNRLMPPAKVDPPTAQSPPVVSRPDDEAGRQRPVRKARPRREIRRGRGR